MFSIGHTMGRGCGGWFSPPVFCRFNIYVVDCSTPAPFRVYCTSEIVFVFILPDWLVECLLCFFESNAAMCVLNRLEKFLRNIFFHLCIMYLHLL